MGGGGRLWDQCLIVGSAPAGLITTFQFDVVLQVLVAFKEHRTPFCGKVRKVIALECFGGCQCLLPGKVDINRQCRNGAENQEECENGTEQRKAKKKGPAERLTVTQGRAGFVVTA